MDSFDEYSDRAQKATDLFDAFSDRAWRVVDLFDAFSGRGTAAYSFDAFLDNN